MTYTFQAMSEFERKHWVESLGGTWPAVNTLQKLRADSVEDNLNSMAFTFLKDCLHELESRGLTDQGLYRVGGVVSKVKKLLNEGLLGKNFFEQIKHYCLQYSLKKLKKKLSQITTKFVYLRVFWNRYESAIFIFPF